MKKPVIRTCLKSSSGSKVSASTEINGCKIKLSFSNSDGEGCLIKTLESLRSDYVGKSIMR